MLNDSDWPCSVPVPITYMYYAGSLPMIQTYPSVWNENASGFHAVGTTNQLPSFGSLFTDDAGHAGTQVPDRVPDPGMTLWNRQIDVPHGRSSSPSAPASMFGFSTTYPWSLSAPTSTFRFSTTYPESSWRGAEGFLESYSSPTVMEEGLMEGFESIDYWMLNG